MSDYIRHNIIGNDGAPRTVGFNRGLIAAALTGVVNIVLLFVPIPEDQKLQVMGYTTPIVVLLSYVAFGWIDQLVKGD